MNGIRPWLHFFVDFEPNGIPLDSKLEGNLSECSNEFFVSFQVWNKEYNRTENFNKGNSNENCHNDHTLNFNKKCFELTSQIKMARYVFCPVKKLFWCDNTFFLF